MVMLSTATTVWRISRSDFLLNARKVLMIPLFCACSFMNQFNPYHSIVVSHTCLAYSGCFHSLIMAKGKMTKRVPQKKKLE
jgi:hypothetical protein